MRKPQLRIVSNKDERLPWRIEGYREAGKRKRFFFASKRRAQDWLRELQDRLSIEGGNSTLSESQRADAATALALLKDWPLARLADAARHYAQHLTATTKTCLVQEAIDSYLAARGDRSARHLSDLKSRLGQFASEFGLLHLGEIGASQIADWITGLKVKPQTQKNFRTVLSGLFQWAVKRGMIEGNPVATVETAKIKAGEIEAYTPAEARQHLLIAQDACPERVPAIAIGLFAGLRSSEIERLTWRDIDLAQRHIVVPSDSKTSRRVLAMCDSLLSWLAPYRQTRGRVAGGEARKFRAALAERGVRVIQNGYRHSFGSYHYAQHKNVNLTAAEMGNSPAMVHNHYKAIVTPQAAQDFFEIVPEPTTNVIQFGKVAGR